MPTPEENRLIQLRQQQLAGGRREPGAFTQLTGNVPPVPESYQKRISDIAEFSRTNPELQYQRDYAAASRGPQGGTGDRFRDISAGREALRSAERIEAIRGPANIATAQAQQVGATGKNIVSEIAGNQDYIANLLEQRSYTKDADTQKAIDSRIELAQRRNEKLQQGLPTSVGGQTTQTTQTPTFATPEEAAAAGLEPGTIVMINGRRARVR